MKNIAKTMFAGLLLLAFSAGAYAEDVYSQLAREITEAGSSIHGKKIAIIPFSYADGRPGATKDGSVISERLSIKMINMHKFEIIERSVLDKVMAELKLQASGTIDASSAQQLGKVLGVEAIITGTLVEMQGGKIEVNARLIKTETAQAIGASQAMLEKDWIGDAATAPQQPAYQQPPAFEQPEFQQPVKSRAASSRSQYAYGFFDLFMGLGAPKMDLEFNNLNSTVLLTDLNISGSSLSNGPYRSVKWEKLQTGGFGPVAMRIGAYSRGNVGGAFELGLERRYIKPQITTWALNNGVPGKFTFVREDYLTVTSFYMAGELLVRFTKKTKVEPYLGFGLGLSLNAVNMPYIKGYTNSTYKSAPTDEFALGVMVQIPFGLRINLGENFQLLTEFRAQVNTMKFDRGIAGESDTLTVNGGYFNVGMGFNF
ncbi:MAG: FlgO family outer membrane protein [Elusimicrobiota bacterium]|nr:FlgO family outer membrane protein [Elusimicrobiota bacterium]